MTKSEEKRFSLFCDLEGRVIEILNDEDHILSPSIKGKMFFSLTVQGDLEKMLNFFLELKMKGSAIGWEINVATRSSIETFSFYGGIFNDRIGIAAGKSKNGAQILFEELSKINNEQSDIIRKIEKENEKLRLSPEEPAVSFYEELSRLNNELVNMQRELAKKNHDLDELNKLKNEFLGIAAHDLRNPLGIIMGYSGYLLDDADNHHTPEQTDMLKSILSSSEFMLRLLNELLDISAIESGKVKLNLVKCNLYPVIKKNVELNNVISQKKNIQIEFDSSENIPEIIMDVSKVEQVLNNLISNAVKFSHPGTKVLVTASLEGEFITVAVTDQGQGIPEDELAGLFKPFEMTSVKSTSGEKSTGLGLSIVRNLITAHNGKIWVKSKEGQGSTFYFTLPIIN